MGRARHAVTAGLLLTLGLAFAAAPQGCSGPPAPTPDAGSTGGGAAGGSAGGQGGGFAGGAQGGGTAGGTSQTGDSGISDEVGGLCHDAGFTSAGPPPKCSRDAGAVLECIYASTTSALWYWRLRQQCTGGTVCVDAGCQ